MVYEKKVNILLVDDNSKNLLALEAVLESLGQNVVRANSGESALKRLLADDFAVILLDVQMPGMDGFETAELIRMRENSRQTPIIFVTGIGKTTEFIFKGYSLGAVDYLVKPIVPEILLSKVKVFVELKQQAEQLAAANKQMQQQLEEISRLNQQCQIANKELEAFNAAVCHDLRNPLTTIKGFSDLLLMYRTERLEKTEKQYIQEINVASKRMGQLIDDLLNLSLGKSRQLRCETVDLSLMGQNIAAKLHQSEPQREVEFVLASGMTVQGDPRLLQIVLENLLGNAWKYTGKQPHACIEFGVLEQESTGARKKRSTVENQIANAQLRTYYVRDNGVGFDMTAADKLFTAFHRLHEQGEFEGTGIGLVTVQRIIQRHGGKIWAQAARDRGATFFFQLPERANFLTLDRGSRDGGVSHQTQIGGCTNKTLKRMA
ncbi:sensor histidine kinase [Microseira wollei]|uniref:histidine kinase n=1 Tax=Microseira wollei NIES-4236 TaxID=2530354 RepID=A0AAV3XG40_9CYAN|nr:response regulator [Microseira wollei]GET41223.1 multi-sensor signal transduction histidine kinase [Microseira wollei NIES-4236]